MLVGWYGTIFSSPDAITWTKSNSGTTDRLLSVIYSQGQFITTGLYCIYSSNDGMTWTMKLNPSSYLTSITYGNGQFVTVGEPTRDGMSSPILVSTDGTAWKAESSFTSNSLYDVSYGNERFVAVGIKGTILTSRTGNARLSDDSHLRRSECNLIIRTGNTTISTLLPYAEIPE